MPQVDIDGVMINYDVQGQGEPLLLIPYLSADHACYAFQLPAYTQHFSCIAVDLPGSGDSDKPPGPYSPERVRSLSLHSAWDASDRYLTTVVEMWRALASALPTVADVVIQGIFPFCF